MSGTSGNVAAAAVDDEFKILCDDVGSFLRHYSVQDGAITAADFELDGTPYTPTGVVTVCAQEAAAGPQIDSTAQRQTGPGLVAIPAGARSVTIMVFAGSPTVAIGGGAAVAFPAGSSATWSVDRGGDGEQLQDEFVFTGAAADDFAVLSTREV